MKCSYCEKEFKILPTGGPGGHNRTLCYECLPEGVPQEQAKHRLSELLTYKMRKHKESLGCCKCGYNKNGSALEWHHLDPTEKENNVSLINWDEYIQEIKKCILVCSNCHREIHNPPTEPKKLIGTNELETMRQEVIDTFNNSKSVAETSRILNRSYESVLYILNFYGIDTSLKLKKVYKLDKKTNQILSTYNSIAEACRDLTGSNAGSDHIAQVCKGKRKSAYGFKWKYADDLDKS